MKQYEYEVHEEQISGWGTEMLLNEKGSKGWRCIQIVKHENSDTCTFYFEREK